MTIKTLRSTASKWCFWRPLCRPALTLLAITVMFGWAWQHLVIEDDPLRSLVARNPQHAKVFDRFHENSFFRNRVFIETGHLKDDERTSVDQMMRSFRYTPASFFHVPSDGEAGDFLALALAILPDEDARRLVSSAWAETTANKAATLIMLPGGTAFLNGLSQDPMGLGSEVLRKAAGQLLPSNPSATGSSGDAPSVYTSPTPLSYENVGKIYDRLKGFGERVHFIGGDFFSFVNYRAVNDDIRLCMLLSLPLNLLLFFIFVRRWPFLLFLIGGSLVSYAAGFFALALFNTGVFALVLAYSSTFVSYNQEYLVHLCGLDPAVASRNRLTIGSALGTTIIGFIVMLFTHSNIIRQMAVVSLGGMAGFLVFLFVFRRVLGAIKVVPMQWPLWTISRGRLLALIVILCAALVGLGRPRIHTDVAAFQFSDARLTAEAAHFSSRAATFVKGKTFAIDVGGTSDSLLATFRTLKSDLGSLLFFHPLDIYRPQAEQQAVRTGIIEPAYGAYRQALLRSLRAVGVSTSLPDHPFDKLTAIAPDEFLTRVQSLLPVPFFTNIDGRQYLILDVDPNGVDALRTSANHMGRDVFSLDPKSYYDDLLTDLSRQMGWLFLSGLVVMAIYLLVLQRSLSRVSYIILPILLSLVAFLGWLRCSGHPYELTVVHFMGFALILGLSIDYSAIVLSSGYSRDWMSKVLVTGLSTLASFGVMCFARHPVLNNLGQVVAIGCGVSLVFALFVRLKDSAGPQ